MTKRGLFDINVDFDVKRLIEGDQKLQQKEMTIEKALTTITKQMQVSGFRERTIKDYNLHMNHLCKITNVTYLHEISSELIYLWLDSMKVSNQTKLIRLKCLKAILSKCFDNGWVKQRYWNAINFKVDKNVKKGSTSSDIQVLLSFVRLEFFYRFTGTWGASHLFWKYDVKSWLFNIKKS